MSHLRFSQLREINLVVGRNGIGKSTVLEAVLSYSIYGDIREYNHKKYESHIHFQQGRFIFPFALVPPGRLQDDVIATLWDDAQFVSLKSEVLDALRIIEPEVENIFFVKRKDSSSNERIAIVKVKKNVAKPFPLKNMGDGITRILQLILSILKAKGGFFLIDEFENGLYYSLQPKVWEVIFKLAQALKVQVFATTHSDLWL